MTELTLPSGPHFSFRSTVFSHGWADLAPFYISREKMSVEYSVGLKTGTAHRLHISMTDDNRLSVRTTSDLSANDKSEITDRIRRIFRLNEDYREFYAMVARVPEFSWVLNQGAGRLLRASTLWEDMVKMLCTTNCTWRLTQIMTSNLVDRLGLKTVSADSNGKAFPDAAKIAGCDESFLRQEIKMGYRAPYLLEFARTVAEGRLCLEDLEQPDLPTRELYKQIRAIKGFGDYAVSNLLKLLGHYDFLGADSYSRQKFAEIHENGAKPDDRRIEAFYQKYGKWAGLFFWMDVTASWYTGERPW